MFALPTQLQDYRAWPLSKQDAVASANIAYRVRRRHAVCVSFCNGHARIVPC